MGLARRERAARRPPAPPGGLTASGNGTGRRSHGRCSITIRATALASCAEGRAAGFATLCGSFGRGGVTPRGRSAGWPMAHGLRPRSTMTATSAAPLVGAARWTCPFCPLLCDHLSVGLAATGTGFALAGGDCRRAREALAEVSVGPSNAVPRIDGRDASIDEAIAAAVRLLARVAAAAHRRAGTDVAGARSLYRLACATGAICDAANGEALMYGQRALQDRGGFTTTLAEVRARADLVVMLGGVPDDEAPNLLERLGVGDALPRRLVVLGASARDDAACGRPGEASASRRGASAARRRPARDLGTARSVRRRPPCDFGSSEPRRAGRAVAGRALRRDRRCQRRGFRPHGALIVETVNRIVERLNMTTRAACAVDRRRRRSRHGQPGVHLAVGPAAAFARRARRARARTGLLRHRAAARRRRGRRPAVGELFRRPEHAAGDRRCRCLSSAPPRSPRPARVRAACSSPSRPRASVRPATCSAPTASCCCRCFPCRSMRCRRCRRSSTASCRDCRHEQRAPARRPRDRPGRGHAGRGARSLSCATAASSMHRPPSRPTPRSMRSGCVVMAGGIDMHTHIGGGKVNLARMLMPEDHRAGPNPFALPTNPLELASCGGCAPGTLATGYRYVEMGYTAAFEPAMVAGQRAPRPHGDGRRAHPRPRRVRDARQRRAVPADAARGRQCGAQLRADPRLRGVDDPRHQGDGREGRQSGRHLGLQVQPAQARRRRAARALAGHAAVRWCTRWRAPCASSACRIRCTSTAATSAWRATSPSTLETIAALEGLPAHLTHVQFHAYGTEGPKKFSSAALQLAEAVNANPNVSIDVGQIMFGQTVTASGDTMRQHAKSGAGQPAQVDRRRHRVRRRLRRGAVPLPRAELRQRAAVGDRARAVPARAQPVAVVLTTDHPNGGPFTSYPHLIRLLMDRGFREEQLAKLHPEVAANAALQLDHARADARRDRDHDPRRPGAAARPARSRPPGRGRRRRHRGLPRGGRPRGDVPHAPNTSSRTASQWRAPGASSPCRPAARTSSSPASTAAIEKVLRRTWRRRTAR